MMHLIQRSARRGVSLLTALSFLVASAAPLLLSHDAFAYGQFSSRKLTMSSQASGSISTDANGNAVAAGSGGNGAKAVYTFNFTTATTSNVGSIVVQFCTTPLLDTTCVQPTGLDASTVTTIGTQTNLGTSFSLDTSTVANAGAGTIFATVPCSGVSPYRGNCILMNRTAASLASGANAVLSFGVSGTNYIKNPTSNGVFYARILTFSDNAYTNANAVDEAAVAGSVNTNIDITAKVQEKLNFSVAATPSSPTGCAALTGTGAINLGDATNGVLDTTIAYDAHSYFRLSTNASGGSAVYYSGDTLKTANGLNTITQAGASAVSSTVGSSQFGLAVDSSDTQAGNGYSFTNMTATSPYANGAGTITNGGVAQFAFNSASMTSPIQIASAASGTTVTCDTGSVRYVGNIASTTKAGIYRTTVSYIAVATF